MKCASPPEGVDVCVLIDGVDVAYAEKGVDVSSRPDRGLEQGRWRSSRRQRRFEFWLLYALVFYLV
jgi:hypothetical protein